MGRGIDIDKVNYVINFDMPECKETYLHRVTIYIYKYIYKIFNEYFRLDELVDKKQMV
jgi:hypothetical protein